MSFDLCFCHGGYVLPLVQENTGAATGSAEKNYPLQVKPTTCCEKPQKLSTFAAIVWDVWGECLGKLNFAVISVNANNY